MLSKNFQGGTTKATLENNRSGEQNFDIIGYKVNKKNIHLTW